MRDKSAFAAQREWCAGSWEMGVREGLCLQGWEAGGHLRKG